MQHTPELIIIFGHDKGEKFPLSGQRIISIGRDQSNDIVLNDPRVSKRHARVILENGSVAFEDLGSTNGSFVNSRPVDRVELSGGERIKLGGTTILFARKPGDAEDLQAGSSLSVNIVPDEDRTKSSQIIEKRLTSGEIDLGKRWTKKESDNLHELSHAHMKLSLLYALAQKMNSVFDLGLLSSVIMDTVMEELDVDRAVLMLKEDRAGRLAPQEIRSRTGGHFSGEIEVSQTIVDQVLSTGEAVITRDAGKDERFMDGRSIVMMGIKSAMCVPLCGKDDIIGMIYVDKISATGVFVEDDLEFLTAIANEAAISIDNARLFSQLNCTNRELRESYLKLEETQEKLIQSEKLSSMGRMIAGVAHDLKNPLSVILGYTEVFLDQDDDPRHRDFLGKIEQAGNVMNDIVYDLLAFARQEKVKRSPTSLNKLIEESLELTASHAHGAEISVVRDSEKNLPIVDIDAGQIRRVFSNIISNAYDSIVKGTPHGTLSVESDFDDDYVYVTFTNDGPPIKPDEIDKIFDPFFTTKKRGEGTGLGLSLCHGIVSAHGGEIKVSSRDEMTNFTVALPRNPKAQFAEFGTDNDYHT